MKTINFGFTDTPIAGVTTLEFPRGLVNFGADFAVKEDKANEVILTNITSPMDRPEQFRMAWTPITNVYTNTGISAAVQAPSQRGISLLVQLTEVASITDSVDASFRIDEPLSYHLVIKIPSVEQITADHVLNGLGRLVSGLYETGSEANVRLNKLLRGSLTPSDL